MNKSKYMHRISKWAGDELSIQRKLSNLWISTFILVGILALLRNIRQYQTLPISPLILFESAWRIVEYSIIGGIFIAVIFIFGLLYSLIAVRKK